MKVSNSEKYEQLCKVKFAVANLGAMSACDVCDALDVMRRCDLAVVAKIASSAFVSYRNGMRLLQSEQSEHAKFVYFYLCQSFGAVAQVMRDYDADVAFLIAVENMLQGIAAAAVEKLKSESAAIESAIAAEEKKLELIAACEISGAVLDARRNGVPPGEIVALMEMFAKLAGIPLSPTAEPAQSADEITVDDVIAPSAYGMLTGEVLGEALKGKK